MVTRKPISGNRKSSQGQPDDSGKYGVAALRHNIPMTREKACALDPKVEVMTLLALDMPAAAAAVGTQKLRTFSDEYGTIMKGEDNVSLQLATQIMA